MNAAAKLGAYAVVLGVAVGGGALAGAAAGPIEVAEQEAEGHGAGHGGVFAVDIDDRVLDGGPLRFSVVDGDGDTIDAYDEVHERELHLIIVSTDLTEYAHLHPERDASARWTVDVPDLLPGAYRAVADFQPEGAEQQRLPFDLTVPGQLDAPEPLRPATEATIDGDEVRVDGDLHPGEESVVSITVRRGGEAVLPEPYLGARGHLVAFRDGDLAYLHVHPIEDGDGGPAVRFGVDVPTPGTYVLFFDHVIDGELRTARFVVEAR